MSSLKWFLRWFVRRAARTKILIVLLIIATFLYCLLPQSVPGRGPAVTPPRSGGVLIYTGMS